MLSLLPPTSEGRWFVGLACVSGSMQGDRRCDWWYTACCALLVAHISFNRRMFRTRLADHVAVEALFSIWMHAVRTFFICNIFHL